MFPCIAADIGRFDMQGNLPLHTQLPAECRIPQAFLAAQAVLNMHGADRQPEHRRRIKQAPQQAYAVRTAGKCRADGTIPDPFPAQEGDDRIRQVWHWRCQAW